MDDVSGVDDMTARAARPGEQARPLFEDVGVIFLVPDQWHSLPQPRHQVAVRLARYFPILWIDGVPTATGRSLEQQRESALDGDFSDASVVVQQVGRADSLVGGATLLRTALLRRRVRRARATLRAAGCRRIALYVWRPAYASAMDAIDADLIVYHIDDEYSFSRQAQAIGAAETQMLERADCVIVHSPGLRARKGGVNDNTVFAPNGVDYHAYPQIGGRTGDLAVFQVRISPELLLPRSISPKGAAGFWEKS